MIAFREPVDLDTLISTTGLEQEKNVVRRFLEGQFRAFLTISGRNQRRYRILHESLRDFVVGDLFVEDDIALMGELKDAVRLNHSQIAQHYLALWGGIDAGLPLLASNLANTRSYGRRNLVAHLCAAELRITVEQLLRLEVEVVNRPEAESAVNLWYHVHDLANDLEGYLSDLQRVTDMFDKEIQAQLASDGVSPSIADALRYMAMASALQTQAGTLKPILLKVLVAEQIWTLNYALAHAKYLPGLEHVQSMLALLEFMPEDSYPAVLNALLAKTRSIAPPRTQANALVLLLPHLDPDAGAQVLAEAFEAARREKPQNRKINLLALASYADPATAAEVALEVMSDGLDDVYELVLLAELPITDAALYAEQAVEAVLARPSNTYLLMVADICPTDKIAEVAASTRALDADHHKGVILAGVGERLGGEGGDALIREGISLARAIKDDYERAEEFLGIAERITSSRLREEAINHALDSARMAREMGLLAELLELVPSGRAALAREALEAAHLGWDGEDFVGLAVAALPYLSTSEQHRVVQRIVAEVKDRKLRPWWEVETLADLYRAGWKDAALGTARSLHSRTKALALAEMARGAVGSERQELIEEALDGLTAAGGYWAAEAWTTIFELTDLPESEEYLVLALEALSGERVIYPHTLIRIARIIPESLADNFDAVLESVELDGWSIRQASQLLLETSPARGERFINRGEEKWRLDILTTASRSLPHGNWTKQEFSQLAGRVLDGEDAARIDHMLNESADGPTDYSSVSVLEQWRVLRPTLSEVSLWQYRAELGHAIGLVANLAGEKSIEQVWLSLKDVERWWP